MRLLYLKLIPYLATIKFPFCGNFSCQTINQFIVRVRVLLNHLSKKFSVLKTLNLNEFRIVLAHRAVKLCLKFSAGHHYALTFQAFLHVDGLVGDRFPLTHHVIMSF
jgi:hypothetical protein